MLILALTFKKAQRFKGLVMGKLLSQPAHLKTKEFVKALKALWNFWLSKVLCHTGNQGKLHNTCDFPLLFTASRVINLVFGTKSIVAIPKRAKEPGKYLDFGETC